MDGSDDSDPTTEYGVVTRALILVIGVPLAILFCVGIPLAVAIMVPWQILNESVGLSHGAAGMISVPFGVVAVAFMYWMLATGRATWDD